MQRHLPKREEIAMLDSCQNAQERWGGVNNLIDRWLQERQKLAEAVDVLGETPEALAGNSKKPKELCGGLGDYGSAGHVEIYEE